MKLSTLQPLRRVHNSNHFQFRRHLLTQITISTYLFSPTDAIPKALLEQCLALWNEASGDEYSLSMRALTWLRQAVNDETSLLLVASQLGQAVGFLLASRAKRTSLITIDGIAVAPQFRQQGMGRSLFEALQSTEILNQKQVANQPISIQIGGRPLSLLPGVPDVDAPLRFFEHMGFHQDEQSIERLFVDVASYQTSNAIAELPAAVHPAQPNQQSLILNFLAQRAHLTNDADAHLLGFVQQGRRLSDLMLLWSEEGLDGICQVGFEDSPLPIELSFPYRLPRPWAQIATYLVRSDSDSGLAAARCALLLDAALRRLHNNGINSAVLTCLLPSNVQSQFPLQSYQHFRSFVR